MLPTWECRLTLIDGGQSPGCRFIAAAFLQGPFARRDRAERGRRGKAIGIVFGNHPSEEAAQTEQGGQDRPTGGVANSAGTQLSSIEGRGF